MKFNVKPLNGVSSELVLRIKYGILLFAAAVTLILLGGGFYAGGLILLASLCTAEMFLIIGGANLEEEKIKKFLIKGVLMVSVPIISLYIIRESFEKGVIVSFWFLSTIAVVDTAAYFVGKFLGKHKLAPTISASKTIEGLVGGVLFASVFSFIFYYSFNSQMPLVLYLVLSVIIGVLAQVSDLTESFFKRKFNVKDSSNLIPGHGGFLDRVDGYIFTAPVLVCFYFGVKTILGVGIF